MLLKLSKSTTFLLSTHSHILPHFPHSWIHLAFNTFFHFHSMPVSKNYHLLIEYTRKWKRFTCQEFLPAFNKSFRQWNNFIIMTLLPECVHRHSNPRSLQLYTHLPVYCYTYTSTCVLTLQTSLTSTIRHLQLHIISALSVIVNDSLSE